MNCSNCQAPQRILWTLFGAHDKPALESVEIGNWIELQRCSLCQTFWCRSPYEPYGAWEFAAIWPRSAAEWHAFHAIDKGATLQRWLSLAIREQWRNLPEPEQDGVRQWRERSHGWNPIDSPAEFRPTPLPRDAVER